MPVAAQIGGVVGDDHQVAEPRFDEALAAGAGIPLGGGVRLHQRDGLYPQIAHSTSTTAARIVPATIATSTAFLSRVRKGLKPTGPS